MRRLARRSLKAVQDAVAHTVDVDVPPIVADHVVGTVQPGEQDLQGAVGAQQHDVAATGERRSELRPQ
jgi:hypothetical protein